MIMPATSSTISHQRREESLKGTWLPILEYLRFGFLADLASALALADSWCPDFISSVRSMSPLRLGGGDLPSKTITTETQRTPVIHRERQTETFPCFQIKSLTRN